MNHIVVIGAGIGGLAAGAVLAKSGLPVTVLEAHIYPGGCAGTFYHQGYRFDAGATLAGGFFPGGPMDLLAQATGISTWHAHPADPTMLVHLPGGVRHTRAAGIERHALRRDTFGPASDKFWRWQEKTADAMWDLALRFPAWPVQSAIQAVHTTRTGISWLKSDLQSRLNPALLADAFRPASAHLSRANERLRIFVDGQLLISAQAPSTQANALYAAAALDLPRRGIVHLQGGIGTIAENLVKALRQAGGQVLYRSQVNHIHYKHGRLVSVELLSGEKIPADLVIANLTPRNIKRLITPEISPRPLSYISPPNQGWGAFTLYLGVDTSLVPAGTQLHQQVLAKRPLGEGNSVFISISPDWDTTRAPAGKRALTLSTHTNLVQWWHLFSHDREAYYKLREIYVKRLLETAEIALPGLRDAIYLTLPGTPVTFQRFTRRAWGLVGGFPQTSLFRAQGSRQAPGLWMVGDSIFPGQSIAAVSLGGIRIANEILHDLARNNIHQKERYVAVPGN